MYAAIRSPIVAGVTLIGAGAIAVSPIAANPPDIHLPAIQLTAMARQPAVENPFAVFAPILQQTTQDAQSLLTQESRDPFPIVRAALMDLTGGFGLTAPVPQPFVGAATAGQPLAGGALGLVSNPGGGVVSTVQGFLQRQLTVASQLLTAVPTAAFGVAVSTANAFVQTTLAAIQATIGVVGAVISLNPVGIVNSVTNGVALVAKVVEQTTIGAPQPLAFAAAGVNTAQSLIAVRRIPSIAESILNGRRLIANALSPQPVAVAASATTAATTAVAAAPKVAALKVAAPKVAAPKVAKKTAAAPKVAKKTAAAPKVAKKTAAAPKAAAG
jgi:hypothetical protein